MLQPHAFCEHTMQQNATAAEAPPRTSLGGAYSAPSESTAGCKGAGGGGEREGKGKEEREGKGRIGAGRKGKRRGGEVDSDVQLEQGRRLAKAGSA